MLFQQGSIIPGFDLGHSTVELPNITLVIYFPVAENQNNLSRFAEIQNNNFVGTERNFIGYRPTLSPSPHLDLRKRP